ncbi:MAG: glycosyltransferase family 8 protein [Synergistaceae bacterium]|nr:glycosyltransferase family 8 protein [Synergistaceae bacterium]
MDNNIHVALAVYDPKGTYSQHAGVTVTSIFENTKSKVTVHILHDDTLTDLNRERFLNTAKRYGQSIDLINVEEYKNKIGGETLKNIPDYWSVGTLYRLFIPEILKNLDKIIYLDCDIVVNADIAELWNVDIGDNALAGARDSTSYDIFYKTLPSHMKIRFKILKLQRDRYINAGVLLMNLKKMRELGDFTQIAFNWLIIHEHAALAFDQDTLNVLFMNSIKIIDNKFDYFNYAIEDIDLSGRIIHYIGGPKPWNVFPLNKADRLYWSTLFKSEWVSSCNGGEGGGYANLSEEQKLNALMDTLTPFFEEIRKDKHYHERIRQCLMNIVCNIPSFIIYKLSQPFKKFISWPTLKMIYKEIKARIKYKEDLRFWK